MSRRPLVIAASGMVTGVGLNAPASCAAIRCGLNNFQETRFMDRGGEWIIGSGVPLEQPWRGPVKLVKMLATALKECLSRAPEFQARDLPLLLCLAQEDRPGRPTGLGNEVYFGVATELGQAFHSESTILPHGRVAGAVALDQARRLIQEKRFPAALVAGVDSLLNATALADYEERERLLTSRNSNGFIPGEGAAALLVRPPRTGEGITLQVLGMGFAREAATIDSEQPLRADGLVAAYRAAL
ncbi:MAG: beta-ketoacyl synthase N-terminal-like domain-containing protein, partial [Candidatus Competibacteraceae bacterium]|nr:beta-ketoacyl synthase N-terminal-like domain-containing protein [Candidatus Competibacteraceae bacterium]